MNFPEYFADAEADYKNAEFVLFGVPYGKISSFRHGVEEAPSALRQASWNFETYDLRTGIDVEDILVHDYGNLDVDTLSFSEMIQKVHKFTSKIVSEKKFPVVLGGQHSITPGIIKAFPSDTAVLFLDAHMDYRERYENSKYNHACAMRRVADHVGVRNLAMLGVRSAEKQEFQDAKKAGIFYRDSFTIRKKGIADAITDTKKYFGNKKIYLTLDIDVIDPSYAPGTSTPEPFGLTAFDVLEVMESFSSQLVGFDVVEVCPKYDQGQTAILAAKLIRLLLSAVWKKNKRKY